MTSTSPSSSSPPRRRSILRATLQIAGFAIGIGLLWWCVAGALKPDNRESLARLAHAPLRSALALVALSAATIFINGAIFFVTLAPVRRLPFFGVQAVNAIATLLNYLPFKMSVVFRVLMHNRRDKVPLLTIGAWFSALGGIAVISILPLLGAALWRGRADALWWIGSLGGVAVCGGAIILLASFFARERGWKLVQSIWFALPLPARIKGDRDKPDGGGGLLARAHEGVRMLAHPGSVSLCILLRLADAAVHTGRFLVVASILGHDLPWDKAVLAGSAYFLIGAAAPTGQLGTREGVTAWLMGRLLVGVNRDQFKVLVLVVTATEAAVLLIGAMVALAWLRPDRLLRLRK